MVSSYQWSPEDIRNNADNWSLEGDSQLLNLMQNISKNLEQRGKTTKANIKRMLLNADETNIRLSNINNKLAALQHTKFVENRVYEDDETISNASEVPSISEPKPEISSREAINIALKNGVNVLNKMFDKVTIELDDSDDETEDNRKSIVYRLKDPYRDRPIPYIIGSKEWKEKWHIGLVESDDDDDETEINENVEEFSDSSDNPSMSISIPSNTVTNVDTDTGGIECEQQNEEPQTVQHHIHQKPPVNLFDDPLDQTPSTPVKIKSQEPVANIVQPPLVKPRTTVNLFDDIPPDLDTISVASSKRKSPVNLFLDDDDDDFMNEKITQKIVDRLPVENKKHLPSQQSFDSAVVPKKTVNLFDDDYDSFDDRQPESTVKPIVGRLSDKEKKTAISSIFDDEPSEDLFDVLISKPNVTKNLSSSAKSRSIFDGNLFDDDNDDEKSMPTSKLLEVNEITDEPSKSKKETQISHKLSANKNLFDDNDENSDTDFDKLFGGAPKIISRTRKDGMKQSDDPLFSTKTSSDKILILSSANDQKDTKHDIQSNSKKINFVDVQKSNLDNVDPLFNISQNKTKSNADRPNIFSNDDEPEVDYDKLFPKVNISQKQQNKKEVIANKAKTQTKSIFNDDDWTDEHDELFGKSSKSRNTTTNIFNEPPKSSQQQSPSTYRSFLDNESPSPDDLFSSNKSFNYSSSKNEFNNNSPPPFNENIPSSKSVEKQPTTSHFSSNEVNYLKQDSPPPLDDVIANDEIDRSTANDQSSINDRISLFSSQYTSDPKVASTEIEGKPKPKKLVHGLNINVKALLPGAKLASNKTINASLSTAVDEDSVKNVETSSKPKVVESNSLSSPPSTATTTTANDSSDKLIGLTKSRPKPAGKRKASTRRGRQEQYRKSIVILDDENDDDTTEEVQQKSTHKEPQEISEEIKDNGDDWLKMPSTQSNQQEHFKKTIPNTEIDDLIIEPKSTQSIPEPMKNSDTSPFDIENKIDNDEDDWLTAALKQSDRQDNHKTLVPDNQKPYESESRQFANDDNDDWLKVSSNKIQSNLFTDNVDFLEAPPPLDDWTADNQDELFDNLSIKIPSPKSSIFSNISQPIISSTQNRNEDLLFDDGPPPLNNIIDDYEKQFDSPFDGNNSSFIEDDWQPSNVGTEPKIVTDEKAASGDQMKKIASNENKNLRLFSDDDDDIDDLFAVKSTLTVPQKNDGKKTVDRIEQIRPKNIMPPPPQQLSKQKNSGFFDSDSDDGDNLFGGSSIKDVGSVKSISNRIKDKIKASGSGMSSGRLFDDDSDDDDIDGDALFSSKPTSIRPAVKKQSRAQISSSELNKSTTVAAILDDPLADLL